MSLWSTRESCTRKDLESLLGHLSHAATVVRPGCTFLRELFRLLHLTKSPHHFVRLSAGAGADLTWWRCFLKDWNGSSFFPLAEVAHHVCSDASGNFGCGAVLDSTAFFQLVWPCGWDNVDISVKGLVPVVVAAVAGKKWKRKHILKSRTTTSLLSMHSLRCLSFYCAFYSFSMSCVHIPGVENVVADVLSQDNLTLASSLLPQASLEHIPSPIVELLITTRPDWGSPTWIDLFVGSLTGGLRTPH